ncbi:hypothetical protein [Kitasatospora mediocidica]|uniref:hypothetical protein n=1 Tax=Kitasatospora mediocidica TaxID=58352 RepID=UPI00056B5123|nr:hypothetical protein [Kitasatospora mediocidica]
MSAHRSHPTTCHAAVICFNGDMHTTVDSSRGRPDLEPFWPSRQPHLFDQTCPGSPRASRTSAG